MSDIKLKKRSGNIYLNQPDIYKEPTGSSSTKEVVVFRPNTDAEFVETVSTKQVSGLKNGKVTVNDESDGYKTVIIDSNPKTEIFSENEQATTVQEELQNIETVISSIPDFVTTEIANGLIIDQTQLTNAVVEANEYANAANAYADNAEKEAEVACNQAQVAGEYAKISLQANISAQTALTEINAKSSYIEMVSGIVATKADDINSKYNEINIISAGVELANANVLATSGMISNMLDEVKTVSTGIENVSNSFIEAADSRLSEMNEYVSEFETMSSGMSGLYDSAVSTYESTYSAYEAVSTISGDLVNTLDEFNGIYSDFNDKWVNISSNFIAVSGSYDGKAGNNPVIEGTKVFQEPLSAGYDTADLTNQQRNTVVMTRRHAEEFASTKPVNKANYATVASDYIPLAGTNKNISYMVSSSVNGVIKSSTVTVSTPPLSGTIFASAQTGSPDVFVFGAMTTDSQAMRLCGGNAGLSGARVDLNGVNFISSGNKTILLNQNTSDNTYAPARIVSSTEIGGTFTLATDANTGILFGSGTTLKWNGRRINEESIYNVLDYGICKNENGNLNGIAKPVRPVRMECPFEGTKGVNAHYAQPKFYDENGVIIASIADYDCSEAIQRAIDDCAYHGGGKVVLPVIKQGYSYLVTKTITVRNGVTLVSYGSTTDNGTSAETKLTYTNKTIIFYPSPIDDFSKKENVIDYSYKAGNVIGKETRASVASPITLSGTSVQIYDVRNDLKIPCIKCASLNIVVENIGVVLCSPNTIGFKVDGDYSVTMRNCNVRAVADPSYSSFCISFLFNKAKSGVYENLHSHIGTLENFISRFGTNITTKSQAESTYPFDYKSNLVLDYRHFVFTGSVQRNTFIDLHADGIGTSFELYDGVSENSFIGISAEKTINSFLEVYNSYRNKFYNLRFINDVTKINDFSIYKVDTQYGIFFNGTSIQNEINGIHYRYNSSSTDNASLYTNGNLFDLGNNVVRCNITDSMLDNDIQSNIKNISRTNVLHTNYLYMIGKSGATVNDTTNTDTTTNTTTYLNNAIGVSGGAGLAFTGNSIVPVKNDLFTNSSANALKINHGGTVLSGVNLGNKYRPFENAYFKNVSISNNLSAGNIVISSSFKLLKDATFTGNDNFYQELTNNFEVRPEEFDENTFINDIICGIKNSLSNTIIDGKTPTKCLQSFLDNLTEYFADVLPNHDKFKKSMADIISSSKEIRDAIANAVAELLKDTSNPIYSELMSSITNAIIDYMTSEPTMVKKMKAVLGISDVLSKNTYFYVCNNTPPDDYNLGNDSPHLIDFIKNGLFNKKYELYLLDSHKFVSNSKNNFLSLIPAGFLSSNDNKAFSSSANEIIDNYINYLDTHCAFTNTLSTTYNRLTCYISNNNIIANDLSYTFDAKNPLYLFAKSNITLNNTTSVVLRNGLFTTDVNNITNTVNLLVDSSQKYNKIDDVSKPFVLATAKTIKIPSNNISVYITINNNTYPVTLSNISGSLNAVDYIFKPTLDATNEVISYTCTLFKYTNDVKYTIDSTVLEKNSFYKFANSSISTTKDTSIIFETIMNNTNNYAILTNHTRKIDETTTETYYQINSKYRTFDVLTAKNIYFISNSTITGLSTIEFDGVKYSVTSKDIEKNKIYKLSLSNNVITITDYNPNVLVQNLYYLMLHFNFHDIYSQSIDNAFIYTYGWGKSTKTPFYSVTKILTIISSYINLNKSDIVITVTEGIYEFNEYVMAAYSTNGGQIYIQARTKDTTTGTMPWTIDINATDDYYNLPSSYIFRQYETTDKITRMCKREITDSLGSDEKSSYSSSLKLDTTNRFIDYQNIRYTFDANYTLYRTKTENNKTTTVSNVSYTDTIYDAVIFVPKAKDINGNTLTKVVDKKNIVPITKSTKIIQLTDCNIVFRNGIEFYVKRKLFEKHSQDTFCIVGTGNSVCQTQYCTFIQDFRPAAKEYIDNYNDTNYLTSDRGGQSRFYTSNTGAKFYSTLSNIFITDCGKDLFKSAFATTDLQNYHFYKFVHEYAQPLAVQLENSSTFLYISKTGNFTNRYLLNSIYVGAYNRFVVATTSSLARVTGDNLYRGHICTRGYNSTNSTITENYDYIDIMLALFGVSTSGYITGLKEATNHKVTDKYTFRCKKYTVGTNTATITNFENYNDILNGVISNGKTVKVLNIIGPYSFVDTKTD